MPRKFAGRSPHNTYTRAIGAMVHRKNTDNVGILRHYYRGPTVAPWYNAPTLPAVPADGLVTEFRFQNALDVDTTNVWTEVAVNAGTGLTVQDERGGVAKFVNDTAEDDNYYYASKYALFQTSITQDLWLKTRIRIKDADDADWFVGLLAKADATAANEIFDSRVNGIGFYGADGSAAINCETKATTAEQNAATVDGSAVSLEDDTFKKLEIHVYLRTYVDFFVDGKHAARNTTYIPTSTLCFVFGCRNGATSTNEMSIGRTVIVQDE